MMRSASFQCSPLINSRALNEHDKGKKGKKCETRTSSMSTALLSVLEHTRRPLKLPGTIN